MRIGLLAANNPVDYHVDHVVLNTVDKVRDLGIYILIVNSNLQNI